MEGPRLSACRRPFDPPRRRVNRHAFGTFEQGVYERIAHIRVFGLNIVGIGRPHSRRLYRSRSDPGRIVDGADGHGHRRGIGSAFAVTERIAERIGSAEVPVGRVRQRVVGIDGDRTAGALGGADDQRPAVVRVRVVGQHVNGDNRHVLLRRGGVVIGGRQVVDRCHRNRHGGLGAVGFAVIDLEGEAVRSIEVRLGTIDQIRLGAAEAPVGGTGDHTVRQELALPIAARQGNPDRHVLLCCDRVRFGFRRRVACFYDDRREPYHDQNGQRGKENESSSHGTPP